MECIPYAHEFSVFMLLQYTGSDGKSSAFSVVLRDGDLTSRIRISRIKFELKNWLHCWLSHFHGPTVLESGSMIKSQ